MSTPDLSPTPRLLLVGGGHAHVEVLRRLALGGGPRAELVLVSASERTHYSGMAPGYLAGIYREAELAFDLPWLVGRAGGRWVEGTVTGVEVGTRRVTLAGGGSEAYDLVSFDVGSRAAGEETPGVREHALTVKPLSKAVAVRRRLDELAARDDDAPRRVIVVGAGSAGVEVAFAAAARLGTAGVPRQVLLLEAGNQVLASYDDRFRRLARRALAGHDIRVETGVQVAAVETDGVRLTDGGSRQADLVIWLTGPAAPALFRDSCLPLDDRGFLWVDAALRAPGHANVFAAGDCATPRSRPDTPKAGVYAVRQAPVLWRSLTATLRGQDPLAEGIHYEPQEGFLSLLNTADGQALLSWKGMSVRARWAWWLKDWIDRRFVRRYQREGLGS